MQDYRRLWRAAYEGTTKHSSHPALFLAMRVMTFNVAAIPHLLNYLQVADARGEFRVPSFWCRHYKDWKRL
jgi:hypothetical protein